MSLGSFEPFSWEIDWPVTPIEKVECGSQSTLGFFGSGLHTCFDAGGIFETRGVDDQVCCDVQEIAGIRAYLKVNRTIVAETAPTLPIESVILQERSLLVLLLFEPGTGSGYNANYRGTNQQ